MPGGGPDIYLVDQIFSSFETDAPSWLKKSPVTVKEEDIQSITCSGPDGNLRYTFERPEKGKDFALVSPPTKRAVKPSALNRLAGALTGLEIQDVATRPHPPSPFPKGFRPGSISPCTAVSLTMFIPEWSCSPGIPCYLRLQVDFTAPTGETASPKVEEKKAQAKEAGGEKSDGALVAKPK
jgi:hypothetical protein